MNTTPPPHHRADHDTRPTPGSEPASEPAATKPSAVSAPERGLAKTPSSAPLGKEGARGGGVLSLRGLPPAANPHPVPWPRQSRATSGTPSRSGDSRLPSPVLRPRSPVRRPRSPVRRASKETAYPSDLATSDQSSARLPGVPTKSGRCGTRSSRAPPRQLGSGLGTGLAAVALTTDYRPLKTCRFHSRGLPRARGELDAGRDRPCGSGSPAVARRAGKGCARPERPRVPRSRSNGQ